MELSGDYKVQLEVFEGPLDLLLYLIKRDEVDIYDIPIEQITNQYVQYLDLMTMLDLNIAGEFIVMAATLMMIKSRMLLPVDDRIDFEDEEEDDPRWDLVRQLVEYKKFKSAASHLEDLEAMRQNVFGSGAVDDPIDIEIDQPALTLGDVSIFDLLSAFNQVLERVAEREGAEIFAEEFSVEEKIAAILDVAKGEAKVTFISLFEESASRHEIATIFLALLELIRLRQIKVTQRQALGEIYIERFVE
ncbi:MAG: segregation/condensation protein A [Verrucomicrobia bacterium]|nr:segregation/condensation protein A [Verrucomicrobiota bacterium]MDA1086102.1 segregation/condensation protein A [Verrucomicrobiota bacterium]